MRMRLCVRVRLCVCVRTRLFVFVCLQCVCVRARAVTAVRWRLMVIAVSRLAFWVESARVGVERVARSRQRSSIPRSTPRTAPCVLDADRDDLYLRNSKEAQDGTLNGITPRKADESRIALPERTWSDEERAKGASFCARRAPLKANMALLRGTLELN